MKTIFALWFALCLSAGAALPAPAWLASAMKAAGAAACTATVTNLVQNDQALWGQATGGRHYAGQLWPNDQASVTVCQLDFKIKTAAGDTSGQTLQASIWTVDGSFALVSPAVATSSDTASYNSGSYGWVQFHFSPSVTLAANTYYALVIDNGTGDGSNYFYLGCATPSSIVGNICAWGTLADSPSGGRYDNYTTYDATIQIYTE